jgi:uncharacterized protein with beta-barrel porin domain
MGLRKLRVAWTLSLLAGSCMATAAHAQLISTIDSSNRLVTVNSSSPGTAVRTTAITGLGAGQSIVAFDARPAAGGRIFYGISNTGQLYAINALSASASAVGAPIALQGTSFGLDFNPTVDRIRLISDTGQNLRINPNTGAVTTDGNLNILIGGQPIMVTGNTAAAYTNNVAGATSTTLFVINRETGLLQIQRPPNEGNLDTVVGGLGGQASGNVEGFDISPTGETRVSVVQDGVTRLYSVNLTTGEATLIGQFSGSGHRGLAYTSAALSAQAGLNANQAALATSLDMFTAVSPGLVPLFNALDGLSAEDRADALTELGPVSYGILPEVVLQTRDTIDMTLRNYLHDFRRGAVAGSGAGRVGSNIGGFLVGRGRTGEFEQRGDRPDIDYGSTGFMGGLDMRLSPTALFGVAAAYDNADVRLNRMTPNSSADTWSVAAYGTLGFGMAFVDLHASYGKTDFDLRRDTAVGPLSTMGAAQSDGRYYAATAIAGVSLALGSVELEPYAGARYANVRVDGFSEGAGFTNLTVGRQTLKSLQGVAGVRLAGSFGAMGATIRPHVRAEYRHEFENSDVRLISASFNGAGIGTPFSTSIEPMSEGHVAAGAGLTVSGDGPLSLTFDYSGQVTGGYNIHGLELGLRLAF